MKLKELLKDIDYRIIPSTGKTDMDLAGIACNSSQVKPGYLFVAVRGPDRDGHLFIKEALGKGAKAIVLQEQAVLENLGGKGNAVFIIVENSRQALGKLAARFYGQPSKKIKIIGITGTNGKTTISYLIERLLIENGSVPAVLGTVNYRFKDVVIPSHNTTPGALELQEMLRKMDDEGVTHLVMEVSSHALDQERIAGMDFSAGIFTNLTQDHLDYHKNMEGYFLAKSRLFKMLPKNALAAINIDDPYASRLIEMTHARVMTYGLRPDSDLRASGIELSDTGTDFVLETKDKRINFRAKLIGRHNVYNILAASCFGIDQGLSPERIIEVMEGFTVVPGRLERIETKRDFSVFVDYAHTPDALRNALDAMRQVAKSRVILVFGCGGQRDRTKRPIMGEIATRLADYAIITSDNPRSEDPVEIMEEVKSGVSGRKNYAAIEDRMEAIKKALSMARTNDIVLIAGKGHENYQVMKDRSIHFDDREAVRECLK